MVCTVTVDNIGIYISACQLWRVLVECDIPCRRSASAALSFLPEDSNSTAFNGKPFIERQWFGEQDTNSPTKWRGFFRATKSCSNRNRRRRKMLSRGRSWLFQDRPVWEHILKTSLPWGPCKGLLGLPIFYHCLRSLPALWLWYYLHEQEVLRNQGSRSFSCPYWHQLQFGILHCWFGWI